MKSLPDISPEYTFKAVRTGGKGGQHVNKVSTKIELYFNIEASVILNSSQKDILRQKLKHLLNSEGGLRITSDEERSQQRNKKRAAEKLSGLIIKALTPVKKRVPTGKPAVAREKRLKEKKLKSEIKLTRKKPGSGS